MKKAKLNLIIDAIMLLIMMALIGVGLLNRYVLITGQQKWEKFGENIEFYFWGFDRHDWNYIHFILGIILFGLLILHIWFHWKLIINIYRKFIPNKKIRLFTGYTLVFISIIFLIFPIFVKPDINEVIARGGRHFSEISAINTDKNKIITDENLTRTSHQKDGSGEGKHRDITSNIDITGSMTLLEVAEKYNVPVNHIKSKLEVPLSTSNNERLGRLKRVYEFTMSDVKDIIYNY